MDLLSNLNHFDKKRPYTSRKLDPRIDIDCVEKIDEFFHKPEKYLELNNNIIVGKLLKGPRFDDNNKLIPFTFVGKKDQFGEKFDPNYERRVERRERSSIILQQPLSVRSVSKRTTKKENKCPINYEVADDKRINEIFEEARNRIQANASKVNQFIEKNEKIKSMTKERFYQQEKILETNNKERCKTAEVISKVAEAVNKHSDELMMQQSDAFHTKKHVKDILENEKDLADKWGNYQWMISLRRPKILTRVRTAYINVAPQKNLFLFDEVKDYPKKVIEFTQRPNSTGGENLGLFNKHFSGIIKKRNFNLEKMKNATHLNIEGKNLLEEEYKKAKMTPGKKYLYREPFHNKAGVEEVYKENFDDKIYLKNKLFGLK
jgi:hypothetical protein